MSIEGRPQLTPEKGKVVSDFQELQKRIDVLDRAHPVGINWENDEIEERSSIKEERNNLIGNDPKITTVLNIVGERIGREVAEGIASGGKPSEVISKLRERLVEDDRLEVEMRGSVKVKYYWDPGKHGGLITYYTSRALDRTEVWFEEREAGPDTIPQEIKEIVKPEDWEWKIPDDLNEKIDGLQTEESDQQKQKGNKVKSPSGEEDVGKRIERTFRSLTEEQFYKQTLHLEGVQEDQRTKELSNMAWYTEKPPEEKELFNAVALLSRAAEQKRERGGSIDTLLPKVENVGDIRSAPEIANLTKEQLISLMTFPGVKKFLTEYVKAIVDHKEYTFYKVGFDKSDIFRQADIPEGRKIEDYPKVPTTIHGCKDETEILHIRHQIREELIPPPKSNYSKDEEKEYKKAVEEVRLAEIIAYLFVYDSHLIEASDTLNSSPVKGKAPAVPAKDKAGKVRNPIPNQNMQAYVGSGEMRYFIDPQSRMKEKLGVKGKKREGWGSYQAWISHMIAKGKGDLALEIANDYYPKKLGFSFMEYVTMGEDPNKTSLVDCLYKGKDFNWEDLSENPFLLYHIKLSKIKAIYELFISDANKIKVGTAAAAAGIEAGSKIIKLLQAAEMDNLAKEENARLAKQMIYAIYHRDSQSMLQRASGDNRIQLSDNTVGAFINSLKEEGINLRSYNL